MLRHKHAWCYCAMNGLITGYSWIHTKKEVVHGIDVSQSKKKNMDNCSEINFNQQCSKLDAWLYNCSCLLCLSLNYLPIVSQEHR